MSSLEPLTSTQISPQKSVDNSKLDSRFAQANKEALLTLGVYGLYFGWWYIFAYFYGDQPVENYEYIMGLPEWFFYSCIVGYPVFSGILWLVVRLFFKDMPLDESLADPPEVT